MPGEVVWVELVDRASPAEHPGTALGGGRGGRVRWRRWLVAVAGAVGVGAGVVIALTGRGDPDRTEREPIPSEIVERWTATVDGNPVTQLAGSDEMIVASVGWDPSLVGLDAQTGAEVWRVEAARDTVDELHVIDDVVLAHGFQVEDERQTMTAIDLATGGWLWTRRFDINEAVWVADTGIAVTRFTDDSLREASAVELLEPASGVRRAGLSGGGLVVDRSSVQRRNGEVLDVFDRDSLERVRQIDLSRFPVESPLLAEPVDGGTVVVSGRRLLLLDRDGRISSRGQLDEHRVPSGLSLFSDGSGEHVIVQAEDHATVFSTSEGQLRRVWTGRVWLADSMLSDRGLILAAFGIPGSGSGRPEMQVINADTEHVLWQGSPEAGFGVEPLSLRSNGFLAVDTESELQSIHAHRLDGTPMWARLAEPFTDVAVVAGALVESHVDISTGDTALTLLAD
jgi:outer membrane protein assembly factor BamB